MAFFAVLFWEGGMGGRRGKEKEKEKVDGYRRLGREKEGGREEEGREEGAREEEGREEEGREEEGR